MAELPKTMKAWRFARRGKAKDVLELKTNAPIPSAPKVGEVMIRVSYVAINPADYKLMEHWIPFRYPATPSIDFVGEVVQIGNLASSSPVNVNVGMIVAGSVPTMQIVRGVGVLAEYIVLPAQAVVEKPRDLQETVAAGLLGVAGQTSAVVVEKAILQKGDRVLLNGASGGVGCILVQVLCEMGVRVTGVCSSRNEAVVRKLGADEVIDYTAHEDLYGHLSSKYTSSDNVPFDAIIDCVGNMALYHKSPGYLKADGAFLCIESPLLKSLNISIWPAIFGGTPRTFKGVMNDPSGRLGRIVVEWFEKGWIKEIPVDSVFKMDQAINAFERQATGRAVGKIFVKVK